VPGARRAQRTTGLYHTAFLLPTRLALGQVIRNIAETRTPIEGGSNHGTHLALYLPDAEGNGIELAWDFPEDVWRPLVDLMRRGRMDELMSTMRQPLDIDGLLDEAERTPDAWPGLTPDARVGHVHLHVADLEATTGFYHAVLGFETIFKLREMGAAFFSAGGYHHHIGTNIWNGAGAPPPPADATGLREFTIILPDQAELDRAVARIEQAGLAYNRAEDGLYLHDPARNGVRLVVEGAPDRTN